MIADPRPERDLGDAVLAARTGDSPHNRRDERGSKQSCLETLAVTGAVVAALVALVRGRA